MPPIWVSDNDFIAIKAMRRKLITNKPRTEITKDESISSVVSRIMVMLKEKNLMEEMK